VENIKTFQNFQAFWNYKVHHKMYQNGSVGKNQRGLNAYLSKAHPLPFREETSQTGPSLWVKRTPETSRQRDHVQMAHFSTLFTLE
jgi:hypothetical protein